MKKLSQWLNRQSKFTMVTLGVLLVILVLIYSLHTSERIAVAPLYMMIVLLTAWFGGLRAAVLMALTSAGAMGLDEIADVPDVAIRFVAVNLTTRVAMFLFVAYVVVRLRKLTDHLEATVERRTRELAAKVEEHRRTEAQLQESNERFRQVTENINEAFWMSDVGKSQINYISRGYEKIWGRTCESLYATPRSWVDAIHPEDRDRVMQAAQTKQGTGEYNEEYRIMQPDGLQRWIRDRAFPVRNGDGVIYRIVGLAEDITEYRRVVDELRTSAERLRMALDAADMVTWEWDVPAGTICYSDNTQNITRGDAIAPYCAVDSLVQEVHPEDRTALAQAIQRTVTEGCPFECEYRVKMLDGVYRWIYGRGKIIVTENGKPIRVLGVSQDITARKETGRLLEIQSRVLYSMAEAALLFGEDGFVRLANPAAASVFGYKHNEMAGVSFDDLINYPSEETAQMRARTLERIRRQEVWCQEVSCRKQDGTVFTAEARFSGLNINGELHTIIVGQDITERKALEEKRRRFNAELEEMVSQRTAKLMEVNGALRESEARNRLLSERTLEGIMIHENGRIVDCNLSFVDMFGHEKSELIGMEGLKLIAPESVELVRHNIRDPACRQYEACALRKDGSVFTIEIHTRPFQQEGRTRQFVSCRDITQRKVIEVALRESEKKYRRLYESMTDAFVSVGMDGRIRECNRAYQEMLGYSDEELRRLTYVDLTPEKWHAFEAHIVAEQVLPQGTSGVYEKEYRRKDGNIVPVELRTYLIRDDNLRPLSMWAIVRDISERRQARQALLDVNEQLEERVQKRTAELRATNTRLQQNQELMRAFYDSPGMFRGVVELVDNDILIESVNMVQAEAFGRTPESMRGMRASELGMSRPVIDLWRKKITESLKCKKQVSFEYPIEFRSPAGWGESFISPLKVQSGDRPLFAYVARDITQRKRLERQILEISSHEQIRIGQDLHDGLCQQLVAAAFSLNSLEQRLAGKSRAEAAAIRRIAAEINEAITEARDVAQGLYPVKLEANGLVSALEELAKFTTRRFKINCLVACTAPVDIRGAGRTHQLYRIAQEAVNNAIKHSGARQIFIRLGTDGKQVELTVTDNGSGISVSTPETAGLGLHIMEYRARMMGGTLEIRAAEGGGTTVSCCIPAKII